MLPCDVKTLTHLLLGFLSVSCHGVPVFVSLCNVSNQYISKNTLQMKFTFITHITFNACAVYATLVRLLLIADLRRGLTNIVPMYVTVLKVCIRCIFFFFHSFNCINLHLFKVFFFKHTDLFGLINDTKHFAM